MAPLNEEQLEQKRIDRKNQIMAAALKVFAENGIKLTKISMIAKEAGISHGLLYHYFKSKEEVLHTSLESAMTGTDELFEEINGMQLSALDKLKQLTKFAFSEGNSYVFRVIQHLIASNEGVAEHTKDLIEHESNKYITYCLPLFIQAQEDGDVISDDPHELLGLYLTVLSGIMMEGDLEWWQQNMDRRVDLLMRMVTTR